jgi:tetratricopeptide (TPR) repeat protein
VLLDRQKAKFWQRIVFAVMAFLMVAWLVGIGVSQVACQDQNTAGQDQLDQATAEIDDLTAALAADPRSPDAIVALAEAYILRGNLQTDGSSEQSADFEKALELYAKYMGMKDSALGANAKAARLRALESMIVIHQRLNDAAGVLADWNQIVELQPRNIDSWVYLAAAAKAAGKLDIALLAYQKALALDPNGPDAEDLKAAIKTLKAEIKTQDQTTQTSPTPGN